MSETPESGQSEPVPGPDAQPVSAGPADAFGQSAADPHKGSGEPDATEQLTAFSENAAPQPTAFSAPAGPQPPSSSGDTAAFGQQPAFGDTAAFGQQPAFGDTAAFGQPSTYGQPWQEPADIRAVTGPAPILVSFAPSAPQRRVTVAFRGILVIPQAIVLWVLGIVAGVVAFIGWWAALFTGQLPEWAFTLLSGVLRWSARVSAYTYLLADTYPPFSLDDSDYPVRLLTKRTRHNRFTVLFRFFLMIPVGLLAGSAGIGLVILSPFAWLITLITGRMPTALHQAFAAIIRFTARYAGYAYIVTPEYPAGLFGDRTEISAVTTESGFESGSGPAQAADPWRLYLSSAARTLVAVAIILGALGYIGYVVLIFNLTGSAVNNAVSRANALASVSTAYNQLGSVLRPFPTQTSACGQNLSCVTSLDRKVGQAFQSFSSSVQSAGIPSQYSGEENTLIGDTTKVANDFNQLAGAPSASQYASIASGLDLQAVLDQWQTDFNRLHQSLLTG